MLLLADLPERFTWTDIAEVWDVNRRKESPKKESPESAHVESLKPKIHKLTRISTKQPESAKVESAKKESPKKDLTDPQLLLLRRIARAEDAGELIQQADLVGLNKVLFVRLFEQLTPK